MNSPICITPSKYALVLGALLLAACAGDKPDPARPINPALPAADAGAGTEPDKGQGNLTFHYANKTTDANLAIDLSSTDVYLEMTGKTAQEQIDQLRAQEGKGDAHKAGSARKPAAPEEDAKASGTKGDEDGGESAEEAKANAAMPAGAGGKGLHKGPAKKPEPPPEEDPGDYEDVTSKVLSGIRRAQELFYQKQYPEALQAVRSSLDARPTAEGYALMGSICFMQGQTGMARRQWMEALRLNPDMPAVVNMLEKTRTPGGRGSPSPRPVYHPPARPADPEPPRPEVPYPEEYSSPSPETAPAARPAPPAPPARAAAPAAAPAPAVSAPQPEDDGDEDAAAPADPNPSAPVDAAVTPKPAAKAAPSGPASSPQPSAVDKAVAPAQPASKAPASAPKPVANAKPASAKPIPEKKP